MTETPNRIYELWCGVVDEYPNRTLLIDARTGASWTAAQIQHAVDTIGRQFEGTGWRRRIVLLQLPNSLAWLTTFLFCQRVGAIPLPIEPDLPLPCLQELLVQFRPVALHDREGFHALENSAIHDDAAFIKLVANAHGDPEGLFFDDVRLLADADQIVKVMKIGEDDINYALIPMAHSYGMGNIVLPLCTRGIPAVIASDFFPAGIAADVEKCRPTIFPAIPVIVRSLARSDVTAAAMSSLRLVISAGDFLSAEDASGFCGKFGDLLRSFYGTSETGGIAFDRSGEDTRTGKSVGTPLEGVRVRIDASGRVEVSSPAVIGAGTCLTRDHAVITDGAIRLESREASLIKIAGRRLHPREVEKQVFSLPGTRHASIDTWTDHFGETRLCLHYAGPLSSSEIRIRLAAVLPRWKIPHRIVNTEKHGAGSIAD